MVPPGSNIPVEATTNRSETPLGRVDGMAAKNEVDCCVVLELLRAVAWRVVMYFLLLLLLLVFPKLFVKVLLPL